MNIISFYCFICTVVYNIELIKCLNFDKFFGPEHSSVISNIKLISSLRLPSQLNCLVSCNLNSACKSAEFKQDGSCLLFNKSFDLAIETVLSDNSNLFQKNGNKF